MKFVKKTASICPTTKHGGVEETVSIPLSMPFLLKCANIGDPLTLCFSMFFENVYRFRFFCTP